VLAVTSEPPWPLDSGGHLRSFHLLRSLAGRHRVRLVVPVRPGQEGAVESLRRAAGLDIIPVPVPPRMAWREALKAASAAAHREPYVMYRQHDHRAVRATLGDALRGDPPDLLYLDRPEKLEYPPGTWAAQDMRKSDAFEYAARHTDGEERSRFLERSEFFFGSSTATLAAMPTRTLARPVVLLLVNGLLHAETRRGLGVRAPRPDVEPADFGRPRAFIPQKARAKRRLALLATTAAAVGGVVGLVGLAWLVL
jgi:hypothetical protein